MSQEHFIVWSCRAVEHAGLTFETAADLEQHFRSQHAGAFVEDQLGSLVDQGAQPVANPFPVCPLCHDDLDPADRSSTISSSPDTYTHKIRQHIALHLEEIALLSLPSRDDISTKSSKRKESRASHESDRSTVADGLQQLKPLTEDNIGLGSDGPSEAAPDPNLPETEPRGLWTHIYFRPQALPPREEPSLRSLIVAKAKK